MYYTVRISWKRINKWAWNIYPPLAFHRWNSCKQNKQAANNRAATNNQMVTPEGEKLHSDSGISVDTQSLQEQQQQHQQAQAEVQALHPQPHAQDQIGQCRAFILRKCFLWTLPVSSLPDSFRMTRKLHHNLQICRRLGRAPPSGRNTV